MTIGLATPTVLGGREYEPHLIILGKEGRRLWVSAISWWVVSRLIFAVLKVGEGSRAGWTKKTIIGLIGLLILWTIWLEIKMF